MDEYPMEIAEGLFSKMKSLGCDLVDFTYILILDTMGKSMQTSDTLKFQEEMHHKGYNLCYL
jgi:hypothetical protein